MNANKSCQHLVPATDLPATQRHLTRNNVRTEGVADHDVLKLDSHALVEAVAPFRALRHGGRAVGSTPPGPLLQPSLYPRLPLLALLVRRAAHPKRRVAVLNFRILNSIFFFCHRPDLIIRIIGYVK